MTIKRLNFVKSLDGHEIGSREKGKENGITRTCRSDNRCPRHVRRANCSLGNALESDEYVSVSEDLCLYPLIPLANCRVLLDF